jgi:hypothetical protein
MKSSRDRLATEEQISSVAEGAPELRIIARVLQIEDDKSFCEVQYRSLEGITKTKLIPRELFRTPAKVADLLVGSDADLRDPVESVKAAYLSCNSARYYRTTRRTGWHDDQNFVYPAETFGPKSGSLIYIMTLRRSIRLWV